MQNSILENIFSIKNDCGKRHKVITLFGVKLKIKNINIHEAIEDFKVMYSPRYAVMGGGNSR